MTEDIDLELEFMSGKFFDEETILLRKKYLYKHFKTDTQKQFVRYYLIFKSLTHFVDHTGHDCSKQWLHKLKNKLIILMDLHAKAKAEFDFETVTKIESGEYKL